MKKVFIFVLILCSLLLTACKNKKEEVIFFDNTEPLSLAPDVSWALVVEPYAAFHSQADWTSESSAHCRRGDILQVLGNSQDKEAKIWYYFEKGWLPEDSVKIYSNRYKALNAQKDLEEQ